jgi:nucleoside phosphorylase
VRSGLIIVSFAVPEESRPFEKRLPQHTPIRVVHTGIGPAKARETFSFLVEPSRPALLISSGFAGALDPALVHGDIVFDCHTTPHLERILTAIGGRECIFAGVEQVATSSAEKAALRQATGANVVEMESVVLTGLCRDAGIPCATVRVISDVADEDLPLDFNRVISPNGRPIARALLAELAQNPARLSSLFRFRRRIRQASVRLADALQALLLRQAL